jgi:heme exporter protein CcmD
MSGFWAMGGYAAYIWPAYGISFAALGAMAWWVVRAYLQAKATLLTLEGKKL